MTLQLTETEKAALMTSRLAANQWLNRNVRDEGVDIRPEELSAEVREEAAYKTALVDAIDKVLDSMGIRRFECVDCEKLFLRSEIVWDENGEDARCGPCLSAEEKRESEPIDAPQREDPDDEGLAHRETRW